MNYPPILTKSKNAFSVLLICSAVFLFGAALVTNTDGQTSPRRTTARSGGNVFTPGCNLPFKGVRNPVVDDHCGIAGGSSKPAKQAESRAKNNFCATPKSPRVITYQELVDLQRKSTDVAHSLPDRKAVRDLGEGDHVSYVAFVKEAHYSNVRNGEAVNCNIPGKAANDIHIVLLNDLDDDICESITAEMSPHFRPPEWTDKNIMRVSAGRPVRFRGHLFFDGSHKPCSGDSRPNPKRASVWEIHPVYSVEVCSETTITQCQKPRAKWTSLSKLVASDNR